MAALAPEEATIVVENLSAVRLWGLPLFGPGDLRSAYRLEQLAPGIWGYSSLGGVAKGASFLSNGHHASYINRAAAVFRHIAGVPTDQEPPAAR